MITPMQRAGLVVLIAILLMLLATIYFHELLI